MSSLLGPPCIIPTWQMGTPTARKAVGPHNNHRRLKVNPPARHRGQGTAVEAAHLSPLLPGRVGSMLLAQEKKKMSRGGDSGLHIISPPAQKTPKRRRGGGLDIVRWRVACHDFRPGERDPRGRTSTSVETNYSYFPVSRL